MFKIIAQHNGQKKKHNRTNNDLQNIHIKTKDGVTRTPLKTTSDTRHVKTTIKSRPPALWTCLQVERDNLL